MKMKPETPKQIDQKIDPSADAISINSWGQCTEVPELRSSPQEDS